jgi:class 3 adenylate cyclase
LSRVHAIAAQATPPAAGRAIPAAALSGRAIGAPAGMAPEGSRRLDACTGTGAEEHMTHEERRQTLHAQHQQLRAVIAEVREAALEVLRQIGDAEQKAISAHKGAIVKRLGDGAMAVFGEAEQAVSAALEAQREISKIEVEGDRPKQRAGVHRGTPRKVKGDFLGVDVNIAARVGDCAEGGEVLISETVRDQLDGRRFRFGRSRELAAPGAPADLTICSVKSRRKPSARLPRR